MILDIDLGNSRIKWRSSAEVEHLCVHSSFSELLTSWQRLAGVERVRVATVVDAVQVENLRLWCWQQWRVAIEVAIVARNIFGLQIAYSDASALGVDRWLAMHAVKKYNEGVSAIIVSGGTALTADYLAADGCHLGGYIFPGWRAAIKGLLGEVDRIPQANVQLSADWRPGMSTESCLNGGVALSYRSLIRALAREYPPQFLAEKMVLTGGDGEWLLGQLDGASIEVVYNPMLVLDGLGVVLP